MKHPFSLATVLLSFGIVFYGCEPISYSEHALLEYDGILTWERQVKSAEWANRYDHKAVVFENQMWVVGGYTPGNVRGDSYFEDVWRSSDGIQWQLATDNAPWKGRRGHELIVFDDGSGEAIYLIGGFRVNEDDGTRSYNNDVWRSQDGVNWIEIKPNVPLSPGDSSSWIGRSNHQVVAVELSGVNYMVLTGGQSQYTGSSAVHGVDYFDDVWRSADGVHWEQMDATRFGIRAEHAMTASPSGTLYLQGGMHGDQFSTEDNASKPNPEWDQLWVSSDGVTWIPQAGFDVVEEGLLQRSDHELVFYRDRIWSLPGKTNSTTHYHFTNDNHYPTWTYDTDGNWDLDSYGVAMDARHGYAAVVFQDKIWILGGFTNRNGQANDVWTGTL